MEATRMVVECTGVAIEWDVRAAGQSAIPEYGTTLPESTLESIRQNKVAIKGPLTNVVGKGFGSPNVGLRKALGLYANIRVAQSKYSTRSLFTGLNIAVVRETMEDSYGGVEQRLGSDVAVCIKYTTRAGTRNVAEFAARWAKNNSRSRVTVGHKANILKLTDGLFLEESVRVVADLGVTVDECIIDTMCMRLVTKPADFDVILLPNVYADLIADLVGGLVGGLGTVPGANYGDGIAVFESAHGSAPKYAGMNRVNPTAMILSGAMMLRHLGEHRAAEKIEVAVEQTVAAGAVLTVDQGGSASLSEFAQEICRRISSS